MHRRSFLRAVSSLTLPLVLPGIGYAVREHPEPLEATVETLPPPVVLPDTTDYADMLYTGWVYVNPLTGEMTAAEDFVPYVEGE